MRAGLVSVKHCSTTLSIALGLLAIWYTLIFAREFSERTGSYSEIIKILQIIMSSTSTPRKASATHFKEIQQFSTDYSPTTITQYEEVEDSILVYRPDFEFRVGRTHEIKHSS